MKIKSAINKIENKSIVQLEGTNLMKIVDNEIIDVKSIESGDFVENLSEKNIVIAQGALSLSETLKFK